MDTFQTRDKDDQELLNVSNCEKLLSIPKYNLCIRISTTRPITNRSFTKGGPKGGYEGAFTLYLYLVTFILTYDTWFLIVEGSPPQPASKIHLLMCITNTLSLA